jgi:hypothetical protein
MSSARDIVRLFGTTGLMLQVDLNRIESETGVKFLPKASSPLEKDEKYYPQFNEEIRIKASEMAQHYELFYCLERSIRLQIRGTLQEAKGDQWWSIELIPQVVLDEVKKNMERERDEGITLRSEDPLDYTTFGQLGDIINSNWVLFADTFRSQKAVSKVVRSLNMLRGPIAHCCPLAEDEVDRLTLTIKDWFRLME